MGGDADWTVREHAGLALARMTGEQFAQDESQEWRKWWNATSIEAKQDRLIKELAAEEADARHAAARALRALATPALEERLLKLLRPPTQLRARERTSLIEALDRVGTAKSLPYFVARASVGDRAAAWALGKRGGEKAEEALLKGFRRNRSLDFMLNLDRVKSRKCGPFVAALCRQFPSLINSSAGSEDVRYGPAPRERVLANLIRRSGRATQLIGLTLDQLEGKLDEASVPDDLKPLLRDLCSVTQPGFIREGYGGCACLLAAMCHVADDAALAPRLMPLLKHQSYTVRIYAALTLGRLRAAEAVAPLVEVIKEGYAFSDSTALASGKHTASFRTVNGKRRRQSQTIRWLGYFCMALGRIGTEEARQTLEAFAADPGVLRDVRYGSVVGLGFVAAPASRPVLEEVVQTDVIWMIRDAAERAIAEIELRRAAGGDHQ